MARIYDFQLKSSPSGKSISAAGGSVLVVKQGLTGVVALQDANGAAVVNPAPITNGRVTFRVANSVASVDAYILTPTGHFLVLKNIKEGDRQEAYYNPAAPETLITIPILGSDYVAASECTIGGVAAVTGAGLVLPAGLVLSPNVGYQTLVAQSAKTLDFGLLSSESGGDADGFMAAIPISTAAGLALLAKSATTNTRGALLGGATLDKGYPTDGTAKTLTVTTSSTTTTAAGFIFMPAWILPSLIQPTA